MPQNREIRPPLAPRSGSHPPHFRAWEVELSGFTLSGFIHDVCLYFAFRGKKNAVCAECRYEVVDFRHPKAL